jgi:predicted exporter
VIAAAAAIIAALILVAQSKQSTVGTAFTDNLSAMNPISVDEQRLDEAMRNALGAPDVRFAVVIQSTDLQSALQSAERASVSLDQLQRQGALAGYQTPSQYLPSEAAQRARLAHLPTPEHFYASINMPATKAGFDASQFSAAADDLKRAAQLPLIERTTLAGTALAAQVNALISVNKQAITLMLPLQGVALNYAPLREAIAALQASSSAEPATPSTNIRLVDLKTESDTMYQTYRSQAVLFALIGLAAISVILAIAQRSALRALRLMVPLILAVLLTAALLLALGVSLSIFHIVAFLLVVGVGSNYALFFDQVKTAHDVASVTVALMVCALSTMFGFGVLAFSSMPVLRAIGGTVAIGAVLSLLLSALLVRPRG